VILAVALALVGGWAVWIGVHRPPSQPVPGPAARSGEPPAATNRAAPPALGEAVQFPGQPSAVTALAVTTDGKCLLSGGADGSVRLWDVEKARELFLLKPGGGEKVRCVAFSPRGQIAAASAGPAWAWDTANGGLLLGAMGGSVNGLAFSSEGRFLLTANGPRDSVGAWWLTRQDRAPGYWTARRGPIRCLAAIPGDRSLLYVPDDGAVYLIEEVNGFTDMPNKPWKVLDAAKAQVEAHPLPFKEGNKAWRSNNGAITLLAAAPNGQEFATAADQIVEVWHLDPARFDRAMRHPDRVTALAYAPDGSTLLTGCADRRVRLWDVKTGRELHGFAGDTEAVRAVAFAGDGRRAFAAGDDRVVRAWDLPKPALEPMPDPPPVPPAAKDLAFIDLQPKANCNLDAKFTGSPRKLPKGEQVLGGVPFKIGEGFIQLGKTSIPAFPPNRPVEMPDKVEGVKVGWAFATLHILHATDFGGAKANEPWYVADGTRIGEYRIHYEDGVEKAIPIVYGVDVRDWWDSSRSVTGGKVAWEADTGLASVSTGAPIRLRHYLTTWKSPRPDIKVVSIDYARKNMVVAPFCVAMTTEGK
jgi:WD40 repeat protein